MLGKFVRSLNDRENSCLTPADYDRLEQQAIRHCSVPLLQAFRPVTYQQVGFPCHVTEEVELLRYVDHNFEPEVKGLYVEGAIFPPVAYVNEFTADERALIDRIRLKVATLTKQRFGRKIVPISNLMVQIGPFRIMQAIASRVPDGKLSVFEAGPGLGYLGALLALMGHRYLSYDVTQALYLWQSRLLEEVAGSDFTEFAATSPPKKTRGWRVGHLPWWQFAQWLASCPIKSDIVYSNSNLGEMSSVALKHLLAISRHMLADSEIGLFMFMSTGALAQNSAEQLEIELTQFGYRRVIESPFNGYVLGERKIPEVLGLFTEGVPFFNPQGSDKRFTANQVMTLKRKEAPLDAGLTAWNYGWQPPYSD